LAFQVPATKSTTVAAAVNTIKSIVGVGILGFPFAVREAGKSFFVLFVFCFLLVSQVTSLV
jgi:amino acid permease